MIPDEGGACIVQKSTGSISIRYSIKNYLIILSLLVALRIDMAVGIVNNRPHETSSSLVSSKSSQNLRHKISPTIFRHFAQRRFVGRKFLVPTPKGIL